MGDYQKIVYSVEQAIARITLNRPDKRNALDDEIVREFKDALAAASRDESVRVVLVQGAGKDFCSGADLASLQRVSAAGVEESMASARVMGELFVEMRRHPRPIIAAVRGRALAGGCGLATACDVILAAESAQFGYPEVNIGFIPAMVMAILRRSVSEKRAFELITRGEVISATEAAEIGMINRVFADGQFDAEVQAYVSRMATKSASAVTLAKELLYHMDGMTFETAIEAGIHLNAITRMTEDCKRGVERFLIRQN
ncbi:MAG TPA: enoyl-CoA hydratase/isomerase family protein [Blastocatellia bacterium]|nr:enoyl-CoA hydratase/isomerase family protein [Blastocatellia bacterium]